MLTLYIIICNMQTTSTVFQNGSIVYTTTETKIASNLLLQELLKNVSTFAGDNLIVLEDDSDHKNSPSTTAYTS